jgi:hypothetical protein
MTQLNKNSSALSAIASMFNYSDPFMGLANVYPSKQ